MIHLRGQFALSSANQGAASRCASYLYYYYYAPVTRTVSKRGAPQA